MNTNNDMITKNELIIITIIVSLTLLLVVITGVAT